LCPFVRLVLAGWDVRGSIDVELWHLRKRIRNCLRAELELRGPVSNANQYCVAILADRVTLEGMTLFRARRGCSECGVTTKAWCESSQVDLYSLRLKGTPT
jgi:hypothetical protein